MASKKLALAVLVGVMAVSIMGGCSSTQTAATQSTSHKQFIEVHEKNGGTVTININHIVTINHNGAIHMDTSSGRDGGMIFVTESYDQIVKELGKGN